MADGLPGRQNPEPNLDPPIEQLKIVGTPRVQETDEPFYKVQLELSRELTVSEHEALAGLSLPLYTPAGVVYVAKDLQRLTVIQTTIELVAEHREAFKGIVARIAAEGEARRQEAVKARRKAGEITGARRIERARRRSLAAETTFE